MTNKARRKLITYIGATTVAVPVSALIGSRAFAALVDEASPEATNWEYVATSAAEGKSCSNCALFQGAADAESGGCPLFPGSEVHATGHCKAYSPKPG